MINLEQFYEVVLVSHQAYCKVNGCKPTMFLCSKELRLELGTTILGLPIEIDDTLYGYNDFYWL